MTSSSKLQFKQVSRYKYSADHGYGLIKASSSYHILKDNQIIKWEPVSGFYSVEAAENFLNARNYIEASVDFIDVSSDDFAYILEAYAFRSVGDDRWLTEIEDNQVFLTIEDDEAILNIESPSGSVDARTFDRLDDLMVALDSFYDSGDIYTSKAIKVGQYISAAINVRDLAKNLVRVRSSNVWAYGMNLRDRKDKTGEVLVQFKGKGGGPGDIYIYYDVPLVVWRKWLSATSKGHYFWQYIRNAYA